MNRIFTKFWLSSFKWSPDETLMKTKIKFTCVLGVNIQRVLKLHLQSGAIFSVCIQPLYWRFVIQIFSFDADITDSYAKMFDFFYKTVKIFMISTNYVYRSCIDEELFASAIIVRKLQVNRIHTKVTIPVFKSGRLVNQPLVNIRMSCGFKKA